MQPIIVLSTFDGCACGLESLKRAGIPVKYYFASEIDKYAIQVAMKNHPEIIQIGDVTKVHYADGVLFTEAGMFDIGRIDLLIGGSPCFVVGSKVLTRYGYKNIEDIKVGDEVLSHTGNWRRVLKIGGNPESATRIIKGTGNLGIETTDEHPFYTKIMGREYVPARRTTIRTFSTPAWTNAKNLTKNHYCSSTPLPENKTKDIEEIFWYMIGRYTGDGWYRKSKRIGRKNSYMYQFIICCGHDEFESLKEKFEEFKKVYGFNYNYSKERTGYKFRICSQKLVKFVELIGTRSYNKRVHPELFDNRIENMKAYISGMIDSDGNYREKSNSYRITSTSYELMTGLQQILLTAYNIPVGIEFFKRPLTCIIEGRVVNQKDTYTICWKYDKRKQDKAFFDKDDNHIWLPVKENIETGSKKMVYNLEVEIDNSYTVNNIIVHNCQGFSFSGKGLNFDDPRSKLFFEYVRILNEIRLYNSKVNFLLENVRMKKEHQKVISEFLGVEAVAVNSTLVSAQNRYRLYWSNWVITQPEDRHIYLKDILETEVVPVIKNRGVFIEKRDKSQCLDANYWKGVDNHGQRTVCAAMRGRYVVDGHRQDGKMSVAGLTTQRFEVRDDGKTNTLTTVSKDNLIIHNYDGRKVISVDEVQGCILVGKADLNGHDYLKRVYSQDGKAPTLTAHQGGNQEPKVCLNKRISDNIKGGEEKANCLTASAHKGAANNGMTNVLEEENGVLYWRKLTPIECERLQTLNDNYTAGVSDSQRYKMIGNGWTIEVIVGIFKNLYNL